MDVVDNTPAGEPVTYAVVEGQPLTLDASSGVLGFASDAAGDPLTAVLVSGPTNGSLSAFGADGSFTYTPNAGFIGTDSFTFYPTNGVLDGDPVTISLQVDQVANLVQVRSDAFTDAVRPGDATTFSLGNDFANTPVFTDVEWDFDYDGTTFVSAATGTSATTTFAATRGYEVAARVTDATGVSTLLTQEVTVGYLAPVVTTQGDLTVDPGSPVTFQATATFDGDAQLANVTWQVSYEGGDPQADAATGLTDTHTFATFGDYDVVVDVTDTNGNTGEASFHVLVNEVTPTATVTVDHTQVFAGGSVTFTVDAADPDALDALSVFADWTGDGNPDEVLQSDWVDNPDSSFSFTHVYPDASPAGGFQAAITVQDEDGAGVTCPVTIQVTKVQPTALLIVTTPAAADDDPPDLSHQLAATPGSAEDVWYADPTPNAPYPGGAPIGTPGVDGSGDVLGVVGVTDPDPDAPLVYHWSLFDREAWLAAGGTGDQAPVTTAYQSESPDLPLPALAADTYLVVTGYVTDVRNHVSSATQTLEVVQSFPVAVATQVGSPIPHDPHAIGALPLDPNNADFQNAYVSGVSAPAIYGELLPDNVNQAGDYNYSSHAPPFNMAAYYDPYREGTTLVVDQSRPLNNADGTVGSPPSATTTLTFQLDPASLARAQAAGTLFYSFSVTIYEVEQFSFFGPDHNLTLHTFTVATTDPTLDLTQIPGYGEQDRQIMVTAYAWVYGGAGNPPAYQTPEYGFVLITPKSPTTLQWLSGAAQQAYNVYQGLEGLAQQFGSRATEVANTIAANPMTFVQTLGNALSGALKQILGSLTNPADLGSVVLTWLGTKLPPTLQGLANVDLTSTSGVTQFLLQYAGLTTQHLQQVVLDAIGPSNAAALTSLLTLLQPVLNDPNGVLDLMQQLPTLSEQVGQQLQGLNLTTLLKNAAEQAVQEIVPGVLLQLGAKFVPGFSMVLSVTNSLTWLLNNQARLTGVIGALLDGLGDLATGGAQATKDLQKRLYEAFMLVLPVGLDFAAAQFGLDALPGKLQSALQVVPTEVDKLLRQVVNAVVSKVKAALRLTPGSGTPLGAKVPFTYQPERYLLWAVGTSSGPRVLWSLADGTMVNQLTPVLVNGNTTLTGDLNAVLTAAKALSDKLASLKASPTGAGGGVTLGQLSSAQQTLQAALVKLGADLETNPCGILELGACFAAGTKLLTPLGWWPVEELYEGMLVRSRPEGDPHTETRWNTVEAKFVRTGRVLHLHVGGEVIRTTPEHPFYVFDRGWTAAGALQPGDWLSTMSGGWAAVEEVFDTGLDETVYNVRVAQDHTYFVGDDGWEEPLWAHNTCAEAFAALAASPEMSGRKVTVVQLEQVTGLGALFSPAYKVRHTSLADFQAAVELALDRAGLLATRQHLSDVTLLTVKQAAEVSRQQTVALDPSLENPYAEGTASYLAFQNNVLGNPVNRGYYQRILALDQWEYAHYGTNTSYKGLVAMLPGGKDAGRFKGLSYQLARTEAYMQDGTLVAVEMPLNGG